MLQIVSFTCNCGYKCDGPKVNELMDLHCKECPIHSYINSDYNYEQSKKELTKQDLAQIYNFVGRQALPYDNEELHLAVKKLGLIVESNELDK